MSSKKPVVWTLHDEWAITPHCAYTLQGTKMKNGLFVCPSINTPPRLLWDNSAHLTAWKNGIYRRSKLHIVVPSFWLKERVQRTALGAQDVRLVPNGIDTASFIRTDRQAARAALGLPQDKKIILFLANDPKNNTWKGWRYARQAINEFENDPTALFVSVGNASPQPDEENIRHVGMISDKGRLALYYSAADALLFTSIAENFPLVVLEAMSCGLPIVSFDVGGVKEAVTHLENGYIAGYLDVNGLVKGLHWILSISPDSREKIARSSIEKVATCYDSDRMMREYLSLYHEISAAVAR